MFQNFDLGIFLLAVLPVLLAITVHEAAHGYAARHYGDRTAEMMGRLTLNPIKHIDPVGTILVPALMFMFTPFLFGWAKPVPVNFDRLRNPKRDMLWVAAAGPGVNLLMAFGWALLFKLALLLPFNVYTRPLAMMSDMGININLMLMVLNLLPLPPLDGGRIAVSLLPMPMAIKFSQLERWGIPILLLLSFLGILSSIMWPFVAMFKQLIIFIFQLN